jgi:hypothetical protein
VGATKCLDCNLGIVTLPLKPKMREKKGIGGSKGEKIIKQIKQIEF